MKNRWVGAPASAVEQFVYQSRLVGKEESLVLWGGGGNNSVKTTATDLLGNRMEVMLIKSSGSSKLGVAGTPFGDGLRKTESWFRKLVVQ